MSSESEDREGAIFVFSIAAFWIFEVRCTAIDVILQERGPDRDQVLAEPHSSMDILDVVSLVDFCRSFVLDV